MVLCGERILGRCRNGKVHSWCYGLKNLEGPTFLATMEKPTCSGKARERVLNIILVLCSPSATLPLILSSNQRLCGHKNIARYGVLRPELEGVVTGH